ncbi:hypothetical protein NDU88_008316 [Pleurodeles waltl]|uniref:Uncharacterized protein n=1 Tax=Pleurodeles waltl TaxID=8319 RepID=A0AAV7QUB5_PLEWA|nr:hypothetical protein NDU88_008316 [Pleurodeles waltl]
MKVEVNAGRGQKEDDDKEQMENADGRERRRRKRQNGGKRRVGKKKETEPKTQKETQVGSWTGKQVRGRTKRTRKEQEGPLEEPANGGTTRFQETETGTQPRPRVCARLQGSASSITRMGKKRQGEEEK